ncbi:MAG: hypothetical protein K5877_02550 [Lachnospiraceae bacterium]|nr:hypothetical protein [Lachnospiraceae bacterium]
MKRRLYALLTCICLSLFMTACTGKDNNVDNTVSTADTESRDTSLKSEDVPDNEVSQTDQVKAEEKPDTSQSASHDPVAVFDFSSVFLIDGDDTAKKIVETQSTEGYISSAEYINGFVYVIKEAYDIGGYQLDVYDAEGNLVATPLYETQKTYVNLVEYQGKVYIDCTDYKRAEGESKAEVYVYDPATKLCTHDFALQNLERDIQDAGYSFLTYKNSLLLTLKSFDGEIFAGYGEDFRDICQLDAKTGEKIKNVLKLPEKASVEEVSGDYIWVRLWDYENDNCTITIYDLKNTEYEEVYNGDYDNAINLVGASDGKFYCYTSSDIYFHSEITLSEYDAKKHEFKTLQKGEAKAGTAGYYYTMFVTGFKAAPSDLYYLDVSDDKLAWIRLDLNTESTKVTGAAVYEYAWRKYADVKGEKDGKDYPDKDVSYYKYYIETVTIKDTVKNADKINAVLSKRDEELLKVCRDKIKEDIPEEYLEEGYYYSESNERTLSNIFEIGSHYLTINFDGYDYWGGAHGMPYMEHYMFDLDTGKEVKLSDLCTMDENVFKNLVAMKTVEDWKNNDQGYYETYDMNPEYGKELYKQVKESVSKDMTVSYDKDAIFVEFSPYVLGPYASGFITVRVSYEELGINVN